MFARFIQKESLTRIQKLSNTKAKKYIFGHQVHLEDGTETLKVLFKEAFDKGHLPQFK